MAVGDDAAAAGYPLVPPSGGPGTGGEVKEGYIEINRTRDLIAQLKALIVLPWTVDKGGTGAADAAGARTNLGISSGTANASDAVGGAVDGNIYFKVIT